MSIEKMIRLRYSLLTLHLFYVLGGHAPAIYVHARFGHGLPERQKGVEYE